jgi:putative flavoprotein involved in K+ transport
VITDSVGLRRSIADRLLDVRPMFVALDHDNVVWSDGEPERVDAVILATGYRPSLEYLRPLGALAPDGAPLHSGGISTTHLGLVYLGLEFQRTYASNTLRGISDDASAVIKPLVAWVGDAPLTVGLARQKATSRERVCEVAR